MELVPPGCHRRNVAEVAIRNLKVHFLSILAGVADDFPMQLWDRLLLLPQAEITINLLQQSNATPKVSAYSHMNGPFDYNKMSLAPIGCKVQVHEKTDKSGTWAYHCVDGWYLSTSNEHYRAHKCHVKATKGERVSDTVQFQHKDITNPTVTPHDKIMTALADCAKAIKGIKNVDSTQDLRDLQHILNDKIETHHDDPNEMLFTKVPQPQPLPRVDATPDPTPTHMMIRSMMNDSNSDEQPFPRVDTISNSDEQLFPRVDTTEPLTCRSPKRRRRHPPKKAATKVPASAPANNMRSKTRAAAQLAAPPASNTRAAKARQAIVESPTQKRADKARQAHVKRMAAAKKKPTWPTPTHAPYEQNRKRCVQSISSHG